MGLDSINYSQVMNEWKTIHSGNDNLEMMLNGIKQVRDTVAATMGAKGKTVIIHDKSMNTSYPTKDGVSVAKAIYLKNDVENIGASQIKEVANNVVKASGDGTSASIVFSEALASACVDLIKQGYEAFDILKALDEIQEHLHKHLELSIKSIETIDEMRAIAYISSNSDDEITNLIVDAITSTTEDTVINLEYGNSVESYIELTKGYSIDRGFMNENFKDPNKVTVEYKNPLIFITTEELVGQYDVEHLFEIAVKENRPLVIIAKDFLQDARNYITMNKLHRSFPVLPIKAPRFGEQQRNILGDIAAYTNATLISKDSGFAMGLVDLDDFGQCDYIKSGTDFTHIFGGHSNEQEISERVKGLKLKLADTLERDKHDHFVQSLKERISKLEDGICTIHVGGFTPQESKEKYDRVEDSLLATMSALEHGYIVGAGLFYLRAGMNLPLGSKYDDIIESLGLALWKPAMTILDNAMLLDKDDTAFYFKELRQNLMEVDAEVACNHFEEWIDCTTGDVVNLIDAGIIDAAKSTEAIINNGISFVKTFITTHATIVHEVEYFKNIQ